MWFEVLDIIPERERSLDEVRNRVIADWKGEQTANSLGNFVTQLKTRVEDGEELSAIASEMGIPTETKYDMKRTDEDAVFGSAAVNAAFSGPEGVVAIADDAGNQSKILLKVSEVNTPSAPSSQPESLAAAVSSRMGDDLLNQMVGLMQNEFGVSYNPAAAELALSPGY